MDLIKTYFINFIFDFIEIINEMSPYLMLGFLFAGLLHVFFPKQKVNKFMGGNNTKAAINASLLGIPLPLCSCGVIPTGISFYKHGASKGSAISFMTSTPETWQEWNIIVEGMTCNHCKENVENAIRSVRGIEDVQINLTSGEVIFAGKSVDQNKVKDEIESVGYNIRKEFLLP